MGRSPLPFGVTIQFERRNRDRDWSDQTFPEAADCLGISVEMLDRVYGHHHPHHLRETAQRIGCRPPNKTLGGSLAESKSVESNTTQVIDIAGGARSDYPTSLAAEMGQIMGKSRK